MKMSKFIKSLYPVKYDNMRFMLSQRGVLMDLEVRMRGWGWIQYLAGMVMDLEPEEIQDTLGTFIEQAINEKIERDIIKK